MKKKLTLSVLILLFAASVSAIAAEAAGQISESGLRQVEQYNFSIHILAMLLVGFGFLMVFVRNYGYSATTGTYLVVGGRIALVPVPAFHGNPFGRSGFARFHQGAAAG